MAQAITRRLGLQPKLMKMMLESSALFYVF